ncbi:DUF7344 domain-containing protein [Natrarchaeobius chitinivorans]|uniref:DUF7344 domain-containing protein n=1 Tax=Natrarchaeobius chitinivorans TaxID=1679083 RepID=UPI001A9D5926|nr:hypothetical protein [Natrarchaeobius chitinivorans]
MTEQESDQVTSQVTESVSLDTLFQILSHQHRRAVLGVLIENGRKLTLNDLTKEIAARNHETPITEVPSDDVNKFHLSLYHNHVPRLAETQLIEYDEDREIVKPTETLNQLEPFLSQVAEADSADQLCDEGD